MAPGTRSKFSASMFEPEVFRKHWSTCAVVRTFRRHHQARHQDLATGGVKNRKRGRKPEGSGHILKCSIGCMQQPVGQIWNGREPISNGGAGHHWIPAGDGPGHHSDSAPRKLCPLTPVVTLPITARCRKCCKNLSFSQLLIAVPRYLPNYSEIE